jgi:translation initiation factor 2 alpha subunit (eIF-2alpha)
MELRQEIKEINEKVTNLQISLNEKMTDIQLSLKGITTEQSTSKEMKGSAFTFGAWVVQIIITVIIGGLSGIFGSHVGH